MTDTHIFEPGTYRAAHNRAVSPARTGTLEFALAAGLALLIGLSAIAGHQSAADSADNAAGQAVSQAGTILDGRGKWSGYL